jgi:large subunit ribosomal protein L18e
MRGTVRGIPETRINGGKTMKTNTKVNPSLLELLGALREAHHKNDAPIWKEVAERLENSRKNWAFMNVGKISKVLKDGEIALVPGKVLGDGDITRKFDVAAFQFSQSALDKIKTAGGKALTIKDLMTKNPKGSKVRLLK